jgi:TetR/AcrR family transcriptional regulator, transcriptional repressor for nem operon
MRYSIEHKEKTAARILDAAGRLFRQQGFGGTGVDGLAKLAGVTNGAFYGHYKSKQEAFRTTVLAGLEELRVGLAALKAQAGAGWLPAFIAYYLGSKLSCNIGRACALPTLTTDVMRADKTTRTAYDGALRGIVEEIASGLPTGSAAEREDKAIALLALLTGAAALARAVASPAYSARIAEAAGRAAQDLTTSPTP